MDLVDEEDVPRLERGEDRRDVLLLERGAGDRAEADAELLADDLRERRLAEARGAGEQHVVEGLGPLLGRVEGDPQLLLDALLSDEVLQPARAERALDLLVLRPERGREELAHAAAPRRTSRTRSSAGSSGSTSASARSASTTV